MNEKSNNHALRLYDAGKFSMKIITVFLICFCHTRLAAALPVTNGLVTHLDAGSLGLTDGAAVAAWTDLSGLGNHATQVTASAQPTYVASHADYGRAAVQFDGVNDWMDCVDVVNVGSFTVFVVGKFDRSTGSNMYFMSAQNGTGDDRLRIASYNDNIQARVGNTGDFTLISGRDTGMHIFALNSVPRAWVNGGGPIGTNNNTATVFPDGRGLILGCYDASRDWLEGSIAELILFNRVLTTQETAEMNKYLRVKYKPTWTATNPRPTGEMVDVLTTLEWDAPEAYTGATYNVYLGLTEPNFNDPAPYGLGTVIAGTSDTFATPLAPLHYDTPHWWVVNSLEPNAVAPYTPILHRGAAWTFTTAPTNYPPVVNAGNNILTAMQFLPASLAGTVDDKGDDDITSVVWKVDAPEAAKRVINRTGAADQANLDQEPFASLKNLLQDWFGNDLRQGTNSMSVVLKKLPAGTYTWTSYHHDAQNQRGMFNATVIDASASSPVTTMDIQITDANNVPMCTFVTPIVSNGADDVELVFVLHPPSGTGTNDILFVINGFSLTGTAGSLNIDFGPVGGPLMDGYAAYEAINVNAASFDRKQYSAFGTTVSVTPTWDSLLATITDTTTNPLAPTATLTTALAGSYTVRLSAEDEAGQIGTDTLVVTVAANACAAAQLAPGWPGFNAADLTTDCKVNLSDFAAFAGQWLDDRNLTGQTQF